MPTTVSKAEIARVAKELSSLASAEYTAGVRRYAAMYGVSTATVSRWARRDGYRRRAARARQALSEAAERDLKRLAHSLAATSTAKDGKSIPLLSVHRAASILAASGAETLAGQTPATLARKLREQGLSRRAISQLRTRPPRVSIKTSHPNQVHLLDASHCVKFFFGGSGLVWRRDLEKTFYKNKPEKVRAILDSGSTIWRLAIIDHTTSAFFVKYYEMPGESPAATVEFLVEAWRRKTGYEFHGVPTCLFSDKGIATAGTASPVVRFAENLGVKVVAHAAGNPAAKGAIESFMAFWEREFEGPLALSPARNIDQLNAWAFEHAVAVQTGYTHSRHNMTRFEAWRSIAHEDLRELPADESALKEIVRYSPVERLVTSQGVLRFAGAEWRVPESDLYGRRVMVYRDFWRKGGVQCALAGQEDAVRFDCAPLSRDAWGFAADAVPFGTYRRLKDTTQQQAYKAALRTELGEIRAYGESASPAQSGAREIPPLPRVGEALVPVSESPARALSNARARDALRASLEEHGVYELTHEDWFTVDAAWGDVVTEAEVKAMAERLVAQRLQAGGAEKRTA